MYWRAKRAAKARTSRAKALAKWAALGPLVEELGVGQWVELRGWVSDEEVAHLYSTATALAIPSLAEGFSLPTLEAMGAGVPVLLSDIDVHRYVGGDAARFFPTQDIPALAKVIDEVVSDADLQAKMAAGQGISA